MNNLTIVILGSLLGQLVYTAITINNLQKTKENITYWQALFAYMQKETGNIVIGFLGVAVVIFIAQDFIDVNITRKDLYNKEALAWKEKVIWFLRTISVFVGMFIQHILFKAFSKGKKAVDQLADRVQP